VDNFKDIVIGFSLAFLLLASGYFTFVRKCNVIIPPGVDETRCKCLGKVINFKLLLGREDAMELPKTEYCVGAVTKRF